MYILHGRKSLNGEKKNVFETGYFSCHGIIFQPLNARIFQTYNENIIF